MIIEVKKLIYRNQYAGNFAFGFSPDQDKILIPLCRIDGEVKVSGDFEIYEDYSVGVNLTVSYNLKGQCSYCLKDAQKEIVYKSEILFVNDKDDADNYYYDGIKIDLATAVNDALLFSQPNVLLCEDCDAASN